VTLECRTAVSAAGVRTASGTSCSTSSARSVGEDMPSTWKCKCGIRHARVRQKCPWCQMPRPPKRVQKHARILVGDTYPQFVQAARDIHGVTDESCCVCGKPRSQERRHDRDHDHKTGLPRGLACPGNQGCNALMPHWLTAERARLVYEYLRRVEEYEARRMAHSAPEVA